MPSYIASHMKDMARKGKFRKKRGQGKVHTVMSEFKRGTLHSGSKSGPVVSSRKQAIAIALSQAGLSRRK